jgi:hypothetical protein
MMVIFGPHFASILLNKPTSSNKMFENVNLQLKEGKAIPVTGLGGP